ncbi:MAG: zinc ribbon domain-containing protein [Candidatus Acidiferrales bacterium]
MNDKIRCQSCGMPLGEFNDAAGNVTNNFATNADGGRNSEYCVFCFKNGAFTTPDLTVDAMIATSIANMTGEQRIPEARARELATAVIPKLRRWAAQ